MDLHLQTDWQRTLGQRVEIWNNGKLVRKGTVEAVMPDGSLLWISADEVSSRQIIFRYDGDQVFTHFLPPYAAENDHQRFQHSHSGCSSVDVGSRLD